MLEAFGWIVHPLAGLTLAFLASTIFTQRRFQWPVLVAVLLLVVLSFAGAGWVVHPAAGLGIALLASTIFHAWRREWPTILGALLAVLLMANLGAAWALFPLAALGLAWLAVAVFSGELFRTRPTVRQVPQVQGASPQALPEQAGGQPLGEVFDFSGLSERVQERVQEKFERRRAKYARKLQRRAARWGVELEPQPRPQPAPVAPPPPLAAPAEGLLELMRDERLPGEARARLGALHLRTEEALSYLKERGLDEAEPGFLVRQIAGDYAPGAVRAYLQLPPSLAGVAQLQGQKTGRDLLNEQLDTLLNAVRDVMVDATQAGAQAMLAHGRFLADKFGKKEDGFEL